MSEEKKNVYQLISAVSGDLCKEGISKDRINTQGTGYKFRGIDDIYNAISPIMAKHGLVILPRILNREITERVSAKGNALFYVVVDAEFDFVSSHDGSKHTVKTFGEAMDSGDKATNKAMSGAYKYAAFQTFCIPTEGDNDADATTHNVAAKTNKPDTKKEPLPEYSNEQFAANLQAWITAIQTKKQKPEHLINMISTKYTLTDIQKQSILNIGLENANS